jgi:putative ABC transport system permease protein
MQLPPSPAEVLQKGDAARAVYAVRNAFGLATDSIRAHKLRSFLTLLGVIIGVGSVILVGAAINGVNVYAEESTAKAFGGESFYMAQITSATSRQDFFNKLKRNRRIDWSHFTFLQEAVGESVILTPYSSMRQEVKRGSQTVEECQVIGSFAVLPEIREVKLEAGRFFTDQEDLTRQQVVVIGNGLQETLFPGANPIGQTVNIRGRDFVVVGIQEKLGSAFGQSQDNVAYIPYRTFVRIWGPQRNMTVLGTPRPGSGMTLDEALDATRIALRVRFKQKPNEVDKFDYITPDAIRGFIGQITGLISVVVVPVTLISLVVGGIVIMNIMLVSVTERTKEIGVRKSLGARQSDIRMQFLLESALLSSFGGVAGIVLGAILATVIGKAFELTMSISLFYVVLSLLVSGTVGIISGVYPALRASKLDPVEALRAD